MENENEKKYEYRDDLSKKENLIMSKAKKERTFIENVILAKISFITFFKNIKSVSDAFYALIILLMFYIAFCLPILVGKGAYQIIVFLTHSSFWGWIAGIVVTGLIFQQLYKFMLMTDDEKSQWYGSIFAARRAVHTTAKNIENLDLGSKQPPHPRWNKYGKKWNPQFNDGVTPGDEKGKRKL